MIRDRCAGAFLLTYLTLLFSVAIGGAAGKTSSSQPICLARSWRDAEADYIRWPVCVESRWSQTTTIAPGSSATATTAGSDAVATSSGSASSSGSQGQDHAHDSELDTDSPLDNVKFLSFEDWKKQNLAKAGQSAENVGGSRRGGGVAGTQDRRRPTGISNALDSLGEDTEIELDFGGFGADAPEATRPPPFGAGVQQGDRLGAIGTGAGADASAPSPAVLRAGTMRRRDAGTTCKERFNYASFDCAATVLKTNPECQGSSSVLIENKDSYMLNECRANNKFLILELCDDILVDTVVLANYEFFSSIFRTFRVSVSDRYPAKMDQWRELGVYEARNTREVQAFAVENPLIWARYLKIEFLTHYGNEFYCPLSLIRVHGTTMLEEYKHDGDVARGDDDLGEETLELGQGAANVETAKPLETPSIGPGVVKEPEVLAQGTCLSPGKAVEAVLRMGFLHEGVCGRHGVPILPAGHDGAAFVAQNGSLPKDTGPAVHPEDPATNVPGLNASTQETVDGRRAAGQPGTDSVPSPSATTSMSETAPQDTTLEADNPRATASAQEENAPPPESTKATMVSPPSPNPTTQESFFKSVNKRLQMLESNSTLSLLYIEEQSRILRDAFSKVEKRQLAKTSTFLETLNVTVLTELRDFRDQYDQVWKTVALEFETQRIQYHQELFSLSAQLGVLADELVFQKRVAVIQSIMVLFCFGLILFSRGAVGSYIELPSVQNMVSRSYSLRSSSPPFRFGSPSTSPGSTLAASSYHGGHHRHSSEDFQEPQDGPPSPTIAYAPPTPTSETSSPLESIEKRASSPSPTPTHLEMPDLAPPHCRSQSSPPVLKTEGEDEEEHSTSSESLGL